MIFYIFFVFMLLVSAYCLGQIVVADWRRRIIPDLYLFPLLLIGLVITCWFPWPVDIKAGVFGGTVGYVLATCVGLVFQRLYKKKQEAYPPIGMGDIKLITTGGIWLGPSGLAVALCISCALGIIWGGLNKQKYIPFAPFFVLGGFFAFIISGFLL